VTRAPAAAAADLPDALVKNARNARSVLSAVIVTVIRVERPHVTEDCATTAASVLHAANAYVVRKVVATEKFAEDPTVTNA